MSPSDVSPSELDTPPDLSPEMGIRLKRLHKTWAHVQKAHKDWDARTFSLGIETLGTELQQLSERWPEQHQNLTAIVTTTQELIRSDRYPLAIESALHKTGIPIRGSFPVYDFPPFKLTLNVEQGYARLAMGRKAEQSRSLAPEALSQWVSQLYQRTVRRAFKSERFCRELMVAYQTLNRLTLGQSSVTWGHPVPLKEIYHLLTLRHTSRQEYPEALFTFDLARLREQVDISLDGHRFELVPTRNQGSGLLLVNSQGQESRVSDLSIYDLDVQDIDQHASEDLMVKGLTQEAMDASG